MISCRRFAAAQRAQRSGRSRCWRPAVSRPCARARGFSSCAFCCWIRRLVARCSVMSVHSDTKPRLGIGTPRTASTGRWGGRARRCGAGRPHPPPCASRDQGFPRRLLPYSPVRRGSARNLEGRADAHQISGKSSRRSRALFQVTSLAWRRTPRWPGRADPRPARQQVVPWSCSRSEGGGFSPEGRARSCHASRRSPAWRVSRIMSAMFAHPRRDAQAFHRGGDKARDPVPGGLSSARARKLDLSWECIRFAGGRWCGCEPGSAGRYRHGRDRIHTRLPARASTGRNLGVGARMFQVAASMPGYVRTRGFRGGASSFPSS